jgi:hypothetical protein
VVTTQNQMNSAKKKICAMRRTVTIFIGAAPFDSRLAG